MTHTRTRALFVAPPGYGHVFPLVPLAWAFRSAAHEVVIATCGVSINAVTRAGLPVVDVAPHADIGALQHRHQDAFRVAYPPVEIDGVSSPTTELFTDLCDVMVDGVVEFAREWRPDVIVYTPEAAPGLIAATRWSIPAVFLGLGLGHTPALMAGRYRRMQAIYERYGVTTLAEPVAWIDLSPSSLRERPSDGWPMRYLPYNGGYPVGRDDRDTGKPRVAVTLGTVVPFAFGLTPLRGLIDVAPRIDATFIVLHGSPSARDLGPLPANVRTSSWMPWDALLATCTAAIHHGGFGTTLSVLHTGLPQLLLPQGADQFHNARMLTQRGAALASDVADDLEAAVRRLLTDGDLRAAAAAIRAEMAAMPSPADVVPQILARLPSGAD